MFREPLASAMRTCGPPCQVFNDTVVERVVVKTVGSLDLLEGLAYYHATVSQPGAHGVRTWVFYYAHVLWFYFLLAAPAVGFVLASYLCFCVTFLGCSTEHAFAAFQIEDWKNFIRFRIDPRTRQLHAFVIGIEQVPRRWIRCKRHEQERKENPTASSHTMHSPSFWAPASRHSKPRVVDEFVIHPRDMAVQPPRPEAAGVTNERAGRM